MGQRLSPSIIRLFLTNDEDRPVSNTILLSEMFLLLDDVELLMRREKK